jgi:hypothetical protein
MLTLRVRLALLSEPAVPYWLTLITHSQLARAPNKLKSAQQYMPPSGLTVADGWGLNLGRRGLASQRPKRSVGHDAGKQADASRNSDGHWAPPAGIGA